jgi:hypothetical protein
MEPDPTPLRLFCPACGADGDAADAVFILGAFAVVAELDLPLVATECKSCETATDVVLWPSQSGLAARVLAEGGEQGPDEAALLDRYAALVARSEGQVRDRLAEWIETDDVTPLLATVDVDGVDLERLLAPPFDRPLALPLAALAAVRGVRRAVEAAAEPSLHARVRIGYLTAVLSLDAGDVLHLSVSGVAGTTPTPVEQNVALALCFEPSEQLRLSARPGDVIPVVHFYLFPSPID